MSEEAAAPASEPAPVEGAESVSGEPDWSQLPKNLSGSEIRKIMEAHKSGKPIAGAPAKEPKQSNASAVKEAAQEAARRHRVKVDGEEIEIDEEELKRGYSHQRAASKILNEGKQLRKQAEDFIAMMKDPAKFFEVAEKLGHDPRTLAEKRIAQYLEDELMDPREKELRSAKSKLEEFERRDAEAKARAKAENDAKLQQKYAKEYEDQFLTALKESQLPPTKPMIAEMAKYIGRAADLGFKMTASEAASLVKEDIRIQQVRLFKDADAQTLLGLLGEDLANKIRQHDISKLKSPEEFLRTPERSSSPKKARKEIAERRPMTAAEWARFRRS